MKKIDTVEGVSVIAGMNVVAKGFAGREMGGIIGAAWSAKSSKGTSSPLKDGQKAYLVLTADELIVMSLGGMITLKPKDVELRVPRDQVRSLELGNGALLAPLNITMADDSVWNLDVPKVAFKDAKEFIDAFNAG